jgi:hypothetical protein
MYKAGYRRWSVIHPLFNPAFWVVRWWQRRKLIPTMVGLQTLNFLLLKCNACNVIDMKKCQWELVHRNEHSSIFVLTQPTNQHRPQNVFERQLVPTYIQSNISLAEPIY